MLTIGNGRLDQATEGGAFKSAFKRVKARVHALNHTKVAAKSLRWVISDRRQFQELVDNLKCLVDDLESLTVSQRQALARQHIVEYEIEELPEEDLQLVSDAASENEGDALSDAASLRMERISNLSSRPGSQASSQLSRLSGRLSVRASIVTSASGRASSNLADSTSSRLPSIRVSNFSEQHSSRSSGGSARRTSG